MSGSHEGTVQVRVKDGVLRLKGGRSHAAVGGFRNYRFMTGSRTFVAADAGVKKKQGYPVVTVVGFNDPEDIAGAIRQVKRFRKDHKPMVAVASPSVFNEPDFRDAISGGQVEVLVEEPKRLDMNHLATWIVRLLDTMGETPHAEGAATASKPLVDPMDISARLRDPVSGRLDARKISDLLGISLSHLAKLCGVTRQALNQTPTSSGIQDKLQPLEEVAHALLWCGGDEGKFRAWLNRPNRDFPEIEGKAPSPVDLILRGHAAIVARKVENLRTGHPA